VITDRVDRGKYVLDLDSGRIYGPQEIKALVGVSPRDYERLQGVHGELHTVLDVLWVWHVSMRTHRSLCVLAPLDWYVVGLFPENRKAVLRPYVTQVPVQWSERDGFVGAGTVETLLRYVERCLVRSRSAV